MTDDLFRALIPPPHGPRFPAWMRRTRFGRWLIARRLGLRCLACGRRAGYGGVCPVAWHNG